jgi:hypothetical protein
MFLYYNLFYQHFTALPLFIYLKNVMLEDKTIFPKNFLSPGGRATMWDEMPACRQAGL